MVPFSQLPAVKKDTIFGAARKIFGPSYFVTALDETRISWMVKGNETGH